MTSKTLTRKEFLRLSAGLVGSAALMGSAGCPGDDGTGEEGGNDSTTGSGPTTDGPGTTDDGSTSTPMTEGSSVTSESPPDSSTSDDPPATDGTTTAGADCETDPDVTIGTNHSHEMMVPLADVMAGVEVVYDITGSSPHSHSVTLTSDDFATIAAGGSVMVESTASGHTHTVTVSCGG
jgi:hypothetical protein